MDTDTIKDNKGKMVNNFVQSRDYRSCQFLIIRIYSHSHSTFARLYHILALGLSGSSSLFIIYKTRPPWPSSSFINNNRLGNQKQSIFKNTNNQFHTNTTLISFITEIWSTPNSDRITHTHAHTRSTTDDEGDDDFLQPLWSLSCTKYLETFCHRLLPKPQFTSTHETQYEESGCRELAGRPTNEYVLARPTI